MNFEEVPEESAEGAAWMATFADLMSLLLTFFVLLLSFANMDVVRFRVVLGSVRDAFGVQFEHPGEMEAVSTNIMQIASDESSKNIQIIEDIATLEKVKEAIKEAGLEGLMEAELSERGIVIRIKGQILFESGAAELRPDAPDALAPVVKLTATMQHQLAIEGHTDDRPIKTKRFPSNWELSTARAVATMRYLLDHGLDANRVNVSGYASMRPIGDNKTAEGRAANRRVEFVFLRSPDKEPITASEIEAAKREMQRMRDAKTLTEDPLLMPDVVSGAGAGADAMVASPAETSPEAEGLTPPDTAKSDVPVETEPTDETAPVVPTEAAPADEAVEPVPVTPVTPVSGAVPGAVVGAPVPGAPVPGASGKTP